MGGGKWSKASRAAADCHFGQARFGLVRREFYVQKPSDEVLFHLLAMMLRYLDVGYRRYEYQA
eukprot:scaffold149494_cov35-Attheya_sp.AAC.2